MTLEQTFQQRLRLALGQELRCIRLWRQPTGKVCTDKGTWVECAPPGAADLSGIIRPEGWRLEVEVKGLHTPVRPAQVCWRRRMRQFGAVTLQVRDDGTEASVANAVDAIRRAVAERRSCKNLREYARMMWRRGITPDVAKPARRSQKSGDKPQEAKRHRRASKQ